MPTPTLTDDQCREAWHVFVAEQKRYAAGARFLGVSENAFRNRIRRARERGFHVDPAIAEAQAIVGTRMLPSTVWIKNKTHSVQLRPAPEGPEEIADKIRAALEDILPAPPIVQSVKAKAGRVALLPMQDVHMGADVSEDYAGREYSPDEAYRRMTDGFARIHGKIDPCETAIILHNGDMTHANDNRDVTFKSQHRVKVKGTHKENLRLLLTATCWQIELALTRHDFVIYRPNKGNHDPNTPDVMTLAMGERYRDNPRVRIEHSERATWVFHKGLLFIASHHGHDIAPEKMAGALPTTYPEQFGMSRHWFFMTGHKHGEKKLDVNGIVCWQLPAVCGLDQHAADLMYKDTAALRAMSFCERDGLQEDVTIRL